MAQLLLADVSEWQGAVDWAAYAAGGYTAAVCRVCYGADHTDLQAARNIAGMRANLRCRGFYLYLVAGQDPAAQGRAFAAILGHLEHGEWVCVDEEEGDGDQEARAAACLAAINQALGLTPVQDVEYSGLYFVASHGGWIPGVTRWVAAYQATQPQAGEALWQCSDHRSFPGIAEACDSSVFNGTADQLIALISPAATTPAAPAAPTLPEDNMDKGFVCCTTDTKRWFLVLPTGKVVAWATPGFGSDLTDPAGAHSLGLPILQRVAQADIDRIATGYTPS